VNIPSSSSFLSDEICKVDVKQPSVSADEKIVEMAVADAQDVGHHAVGGYMKERDIITFLMKRGFQKTVSNTLRKSLSSAA
jgi:hypothetical protein